MNRQEFLSIVDNSQRTDGRRYERFKSLHALEDKLGRMVRVRRPNRMGSNDYLLGGILIVVNVHQRYICVRMPGAASHERGISLQAPEGTNFWVLTDPPDELQQWQDLHAKLFKVVLTPPD